MFFFLSYMFSAIGLLTFGFLALRSLYTNVSVGIYSVQLGVNSIDLLRPFLLSNFVAVFGTLVLIASLAWVGISLKVVGKPVGGKMSIPYTLIYLFIYIAIFPINPLQATLKLLVQRKADWRSYAGV